METMTLKIQSREELNAEFIRVYNAVKAGEEVTPTRGVSFSSLDAVRSVLTDKRLELLRIIRREKPASINALAKLAGRDFKNVYDDVMRLKECELIQVSASSRSSRRSLRVPYRSISIEATV
jgi:predicted transcriptional regulator